MSIPQAGMHANKIWNKAFREMECNGYTPPRERKTLLQALSVNRSGLSRESRENLLISTLVVAAGHRLVE